MTCVHDRVMIVNCGEFVTCVEVPYFVDSEKAEFSLLPCLLFESHPSCMVTFVSLDFSKVKSFPKSHPHRGPKGFRVITNRNLRTENLARRELKPGIS
jgi:hypothetical protein